MKIKGGGGGGGGELLDSITADLTDKEQMAPPIKPKLAEIVNNRFSSILPLEKLKQKEEKHLRPENCP